ncbi:MAG: FHA domain-containing protein [Planctomycetes bacterium]|nr:FHA domain-containing protein [Planctomycetota bacterium]
MPVLRVKSGTDKGKIYEIADDSFLLGRDRSGAVQILDQGVSRKHAEIFRIGELFFIRDLESRNGTFVNSEKVSEVVLRFGDQIQIGNSVLVFEDRFASLEDSQEILRGEEKALAAPLPSSTLNLRPADTLMKTPNTPPEDTPESRRLSALLGISHLIGSERNLSKILAQSLAQLGKVVDADNGFIFSIKGGKNGDSEFKLLARYDRNDTFQKEQVSRSIISDCLEKNRAVLTADAGTDSRYHVMASVVLKQIRSVICVPITGMGKIIGVLYLSNSQRADAFKSEDLELASAVAVQLGLTIQLLQLIHRSELIFRNSIRTLVTAIEMRDPFHRGRAERLAAMCLAIAKELNMSTHDCRNAWLAGMLYDIGSIPLSDRDREAHFTVDTRKNHYAKELLKEMPGLDEILPAIVEQKERWDGSGSPEGKKGDGLHPLAQILGLAYQLDELLQSGGSGGKPLPEKEVLMKILEMADKQFKRDNVNALLIAYRKGKLFAPEAAFFEVPN